MDASRSRITIGRDTNCDFPIADSSISRLHAELFVTGIGQIVLKDCQSSNGTTLVRGGVRTSLKEEVVYPADQVLFGKVPFTVTELLRAIKERLGVDLTPRAALQPPAPPPPPPPPTPVVSPPSPPPSASNAAPGPIPPMPPPPPPPPPPRSSSVAAGRKMVRCDCGTVKPLGEPCPVCEV